MRKIAPLLMITLTLTACSWSNFPFLYHPDVQQGNVLPEDRVAQLKPGMNTDQVIYLLGNPTMQQVFASERTVYVYTFKKGKDNMQEQKLVLTFINNKLTSIEH